MKLRASVLVSALGLIVGCGGKANDDLPAGGTGAGGGGSGAAAAAGSGAGGGGGVGAAGGSAGAAGGFGTGGKAGAGGTSGTGGTAAGGASGTGGTATGGASGTGGTATGGASGSGGSAGAGFVDPEGDAATELDLVAGAVHRDGDFFEFRWRFAGRPLTDGATVELSAPEWRLSVTRHSPRSALAAYSLRLQTNGLSLGLDPCTHLLLDDSVNQLIVRLPVALVSSLPASLSAATAAADFGISGDFVDRFAWDPMDYPGPRPDVAPACQPWDSARTSTLAFRDVSLGDGFGCGITLAAEAVCWGEHPAMAALSSTPAGPFEQVSVSDHFFSESSAYACALRPDGTLACWGVSPPDVPGDYRTMGDPFGCAVRADGNLGCIDMGTGQDEIRSAPGPIAKVVGAGTEACHLSEAGRIVCFGPARAPEGNDFIDVAFGSESRACGLRRSGRLDCDLASAIPYSLVAIDAGGRSWGSSAFGCGITDTGSPICWGGAGTVAPVHPGPFVRIEVSSTTEGMCGFRPDSTLVCWDYTHVAGYPIPATSPP